GVADSLEEFHMLAFRPGWTGWFAEDTGSFDSDEEDAVVARVALSPGALHFVAGKNRVHAINLALTTTEKTASHFVPAEYKQRRVQGSLSAFPAVCPTISVR